jgi:hypothetical protein
MSDFANNVIGAAIFGSVWGLDNRWVTYRVHLSTAEKESYIVSVKLNVISTALQFEAVVVACACLRRRLLHQFWRLLAVCLLVAVRYGEAMLGELRSLLTNTLLHIVIVVLARHCR